jgi:flagellar hook-basal body complex protein FliE
MTIYLSSTGSLPAKIEAFEGKVQKIALNRFSESTEDLSSFSNTMKNALDQVAKVDQDSANAVRAFEAGDETSLVKVMIARQKSGLAFEAVLQTRNKLLGAYKEIMAMQV